MKEIFTNNFIGDNSNVVDEKFNNFIKDLEAIENTKIKKKMPKNKLFETEKKLNFIIKEIKEALIKHANIYRKLKVEIAEFKKADTNQKKEAYKTWHGISNNKYKNERNNQKRIEAINNQERIEAINNQERIEAQNKRILKIRINNGMGPIEKRVLPKINSNVNQRFAFIETPSQIKKEKLRIKILK